MKIALFLLVFWRGKIEIIIYTSSHGVVQPRNVSCWLICAFISHKKRKQKTSVWLRYSAEVSEEEIVLYHRYKFNRSLELSLRPSVEMYRSSTYFFCAPQLRTPTVLVGSWWPGGLCSYRRSRCWYDPTKHTTPNYRPWVMSPTYGFV